MANKGKRMLFEEDYEYLQDLVENHPDPSAEWGGGGDSIQAGTGITITTESDDTKTISVNDDVAMKSDIPTEYSYGYGLSTTGSTVSINTSVVPTLGNNNTFTKTNTFTSSLQVLKRNPGISLASNVSDDKYAQIIYQDSDITQSSLRLSTSNNNTTRLYSGVAGVEIVSGGKTYTFDTTSGGTVAKTSDIPTNYLTTDSNQSINSKDITVLGPTSEYDLTYSFDPAGYRTNDTIARIGDLPDAVSANTGATPSYVLSDIQVGQDVYSIPTGTTVVANSTATPSATLTTLQVGSDTYEIPQGGGSSYTFTNGLTESSGTVSWNLNDRIRLIPNESSSLIILNDPSTIGTSNNAESVVIGWTNTLQNKSRGSYIIGMNNTVNSSQTPIEGTGGAYVIGAGNVITRSGGYGSVYAFGKGLKCNSVRQYAYQNKYIMGDYNSDGNYLFQLGNGTSSSRSNALTVDYDGTIVSKNLPAVDTTTDGTYVLEATVSNGTVTYNWVLKQ